jgi:ribosome-associated protein
MRRMQERQAAIDFDASSPADLAHTIVDIADDRKAVDIALLDIQDLTTFADYFVIMTGTSTVQLRALSDNVERRLREANVRTLHMEGSAEDGWILMDYGSVVVHIFSPAQRDFYGLEDLWAGAKVLVRIQ